MDTRFLCFCTFVCRSKRDACSSYRRQTPLLSVRPAAVLSDEDHQFARNAIETINMSGLAYILNKRFSDFETHILAATNSELGQKIIKDATKTITNNIQMKLSQILRD